MKKYTIALLFALTTTWQATAQNCDTPTDMEIGDISFGGLSYTAVFGDFVYLVWTASPDETGGYEWAMMAEGDVPDTDTPVSTGVAEGAEIVVFDLIPETPYDFYVRTLCDSDESDWSDVFSFSTTEQCPEGPTDVIVDNEHSHSADFSWTEPSFALGYGWGVLHRDDTVILDDFVSFGEIAAPADNLTATDLQPDTEYDFYIFSSCDIDFIEETATISEVAGPIPFKTEEEIGVESNTIPGFSFSPNPADGLVNLRAEGQIENVEIFSLTGQRVLQPRTAETDPVQLDISPLPSGVYLMKVQSGGQTSVYKLLRK